MNLATFQWRPQLDPLWCGLLILAIGAWLYWLYRRLATRHPRNKALLLMLPKLVVLLLLSLALFEPTWGFERSERVHGKILALLDTSSSMDVTDDAKDSRLSRARKILDRLKNDLPSGVEIQTLEFDTQLHQPNEKR